MNELKLDPEEAIISALMLEPKAIEKVCGILSPEMFDKAILGRAYLEYCRSNDNGKELSLAELQSVLNAEYPEYEVDYALRECLSTQITSQEIVGTAHVLANRYKKSCVDALLNRIKFTESGVDGEIDNLIGDLQKLQSGETTNGHTVAEITRQYSDDYFCDKKNNLILLGDDGIDHLTGGFQGGDMILLGARPSCGKSALATQWAWDFAKQGLKVGYYNCEMQEKALLERFIASKTGIPVTRIRLAKAFLSDEEARYRKAVAELETQNNIVIFSGSRSVSDIRKDIRNYHFSVVILDYLQLLQVGDRYRGNRASEVSELSLSIKRLAMDFDIPIIALSQINRASEGRITKEPQLSDLRESGSLEQDASVVFFLWDKDDSDRSKKGFKTSKSRNGLVDRHDLIFDGATMSFKPESQATPFD